MLILAVDTTTPSGSVAVLNARQLLGEVGLETELNHSLRLMASIDFLLGSLGLDIKDVEGYCVAAGPGSFTGLRVGLSTVKSLAFASGRPVAGVSSLEALALKLRHHQARLLCPMLDAKKGEVYAALFEAPLSGETLKESVAPGAYRPDDFLALLPGHRVVDFIGSGVTLYMEKILAFLKDKARISRGSAFIAQEVGLLGLGLLSKGRGVSPEDLKPLYYRKSQAEEKNSRPQ